MSVIRRIFHFKGLLNCLFKKQSDTEQDAESQHSGNQIPNMSTGIQYTFNRTGNIMLVWGGPNTEKISMPASILYNKVSGFYTKMVWEITHTINPATKEPYSVYNYDAIMSIVDRSDLFSPVNKENLSYTSTSYGPNYSNQLIETLLGITPQTAKLPFAQSMISSIARVGQKMAANADSSDNTIATIFFILEYFFDTPFVSAVVVSCNVKKNPEIFKAEPCYRGSSISTSLAIQKETFIFTYRH